MDGYRSFGLQPQPTTASVSLRQVRFWLPLLPMRVPGDAEVPSKVVSEGVVNR